MSVIDISNVQIINENFTDNSKIELIYKNNLTVLLPYISIFFGIIMYAVFIISLLNTFFLNNRSKN